MRIGFPLALIGLMAGHAASAQVSVWTQHNDNSRTGANLRETRLTTANVRPATFGKLFTRAVDGQIYAQPLYVSGMKIPGQGTRNVVFVATEHNSVYAFDADDPKQSQPFWKVNLGPSCPSSDFYQPPVTDMNQEVGITSTPVINFANRVIYVEAKTKENGQYFHRLHALDLATGKERLGGPVVITATAPGTGYDAAQGVITFNSKMQLQRPALTLAGGVVYLGFGSHGDHDPYHGWVIGYDAATLKQTAALCTTPDGGQAAIWQAGQGLAADKTGLFAVIGNGDDSAKTGGRNYGECVVRLKTDGGKLTVADWFMPTAADDMNAADADLGSTGPLLIPGQDLFVCGSKTGWMYVLKRSALGKFHAGGDTQILQSWGACNGHIHGSPLVWTAPNGDTTIYVWSETDTLKAWKLRNGKFDQTPAMVSAVRAPDGMPGGFLAISSNGAAPGTGILWASTPYDANANWNSVPGVLRAYDATDLSKEIWNSRMTAARDDVGLFAKFCPPTVVNGKVYLATFSNQLDVYGLLPGAGK